MFCRCSLTALWHAKQLEKKCFAEFLLLYPHDFTSDEKIFTKILQHCAHCISDGAWAKKFSFFFMFCRCSLTALCHAKARFLAAAKWRPNLAPAQAQASSSTLSYLLSFWPSFLDFVLGLVAAASFKHHQHHWASIITTMKALKAIQERSEGFKGFYYTITDIPCNFGTKMNKVLM